FARTDVTVVIGANDVTNPAARNDPSSPIHGMPILNVDQSKSVIVLKRSMSSGFAGIDNPLFYAEGTTMLFGDAKKSVTEVIEELKALEPRFRRLAISACGRSLSDRLHAEIANRRAGPLPSGAGRRPGRTGWRASRSA